MATAAVPGSGLEPATRLKAHAIGLPGATMQAVATIAPAIAACSSPSTWSLSPV